MSRNIFGWDLPPGCTQRHIDEAAGVYDDEFEPVDEFNDAEQLLIGPLAHIKHKSAFGFEYYTVDFSRPGALARYAAEEGKWWSKNFDKDSL